MRHRIINTIILLWTHILVSTPICTVYDTILGCFIVANMVQYIESTRRWVPECVLFLETILRWSFHSAVQDANAADMEGRRSPFYSNTTHWEYLLRDSGRRLVIPVHITPPDEVLQAIPKHITPFHCRN
uniref:Nucleolar protein 14 n=1 Tax=Lygus hesperus TaxID=30085 RepID=A0A0A9WAA3_LYGHE